MNHAETEGNFSTSAIPTEGKPFERFVEQIVINPADPRDVANVPVIIALMKLAATYLRGPETESLPSKKSSIILRETNIFF